MKHYRQLYGKAKGQIRSVPRTARNKSVSGIDILRIIVYALFKG